MGSSGTVSVLQNFASDFRTGIMRLVRSGPSGDPSLGSAAASYPVVEGATDLAGYGVAVFYDYLDLEIDSSGYAAPGTTATSGGTVGYSFPGSQVNFNSVSGEIGNLMPADPAKYTYSGTIGHLMLSNNSDVECSITIELVRVKQFNTIGSDPLSYANAAWLKTYAPLMTRQYLVPNTVMRQTNHPNVFTPNVDYKKAPNWHRYFEVVDRHYIKGLDHGQATRVAIKVPPIHYRGIHGYDAIAIPSIGTHAIQVVNGVTLFLVMKVEGAPVRYGADATTTAAGATSTARSYAAVNFVFRYWKKMRRNAHVRLDAIEYNTTNNGNTNNPTVPSYFASAQNKRIKTEQQVHTAAKTSDTMNAFSSMVNDFGVATANAVGAQGARILTNAVVSMMNPSGPLG